jgi:hypothetical protein
MKNAKSNGSVELKPSPEMDIEGNIHQLVNSNDTLHQVENHDLEVSASAIDAILHRVREASSREIKDLIDDLQELHKKLQDDGCRIQHEIEYYAELNQLVTQLTKIIGDNVKSLPAAPGIVPKAD